MLEGGFNRKSSSNVIGALVAPNKGIPAPTVQSSLSKDLQYAVII